MGTAHLICVRNLGLKVRPALSVTLHVTARRMAMVMLQLVVTADATQSIADMQPFRDEHRDLGDTVTACERWWKGDPREKTATYKQKDLVSERNGES